MSAGRKLTYLHRYVYGDTKGLMIYFRDGNRLNCTRANLGVCEQKKGRPKKEPPPPKNACEEP
eukprot:48485-Eustigmatos_ZCMA.PRE.1